MLLCRFVNTSNVTAGETTAIPRPVFLRCTIYWYNGWNKIFYVSPFKCFIHGLASNQLCYTSHILRAFYAPYIQQNCFENAELGSKGFGFEKMDGLLLSSTLCRLVPDDLPQCCTCLKCATCCSICRCPPPRYGSGNNIILFYIL